MPSKRRRLGDPCSSDEDESSHPSSADGTKPNEHVASILIGIDTFRNNGVLCDFSLFAEDEESPEDEEHPAHKLVEFRVHKLILACFSVYFEKMFISEMTEKKENRVTYENLKEVKAGQLRAIIDFMYTGTISITDSNVESILSAADYLGVTKVKEMCCIFLKKGLNATNCLSISQLANDRCLQDLEDQAVSFAYNSFDQVMRCEEFLELPAGKLKEFLSSDNLNVAKEENLFEGVISWLNHRPEERTQGFEEILQHIRLPLMSRNYILRRVATTPAVVQNEKCQELLKRAERLQVFPDTERKCDLAFTAPRNNSPMVPAAILIGGWNGDSSVKRTDCFVPSRDEWLSLAKPPCDVYLHGVAAIDQNFILVAGGISDYASNYSAASLFNLALNSWCKAAPMTSERCRVSLAAVDGFVYAVGAPVGEQKVTVERYHPVVNQWEPVKEMEIELSHSPLRTPLHSPSATSQGGRLLVSGVFKEGDDNKGCIQSYDPYTDSWEVLSSSLPSLYHSSACVYDKKLYLVGGWDEVEKESSRSVICFDPETTTWSACKPMEEGRVSPGVAVIAGKMFVFGGAKQAYMRPSEGETLDTMEVYDLENDEWLCKEQMPRKRCWHGCVVLNIPTRLLESKAAEQ